MNGNFKHYTFLAVALILAFLICTQNSQVYGHLYGYNFQEWKNSKYDILIQFEPEPQTPSVGKNTTLNFSVQNLQTGEHFENFSDVVTIVYYSGNNSENDIVQKFPSVQEKTGDFSHSYVFTKGGTYEIFLRIDTPTFINVAKFVVFVSSPQFQIMNLVYLLLPFFVVAGAFAGIGVAVWRYLYKKR